MRRPSPATSCTGIGRAPGSPVPSLPRHHGGGVTCPISTPDGRPRGSLFRMACYRNNPLHRNMVLPDEAHQLRAACRGKSKIRDKRRVLADLCFHVGVVCVANLAKTSKPLALAWRTARCHSLTWLDSLVGKWSHLVALAVRRAVHCTQQACKGLTPMDVIQRSQLLAAAAPDAAWTVDRRLGCRPGCRQR